MKFRALRADEVECRIGTVGKSGNGLSLLLYKDARCDANVLDETVGPENWQCEFYECKGTLFCRVGIRCGGGSKMDGAGIELSPVSWVWKSDAGSPSNMEAAKGEASDAFKRACFKWGIGRELYSAPFVWVRSDACNIRQQGGKFTCFDRFGVYDMRVEDGRIAYLQVVNVTTNCIVYEWGKK